MDFDFKLDSTQLNDIISKLPAKAEGRIRRNAVAAGARVIRKEAKAQAPYDSKRATGTHLRDGIVIKRVDRKTDVHIIGTQSTGKKAVPHAHLLEFGTVNMRPQSFLRKAFDSKKDAAKEKMLDKMGDGIIREAKKLAGK